MANNYLLDSSAWIEYFAGTALGEKVKEIIESEENSSATCILSIAEISDKLSKESEKFDKSFAFIKNKSKIFGLTLNACSEAGKLKSDIRATKKGFSLADAIIYLTAKENSCTLVTKDSDFENMKNVELIKIEVPTASPRRKE